MPLNCSYSPRSGCIGCGNGFKPGVLEYIYKSDHRGAKECSGEDQLSSKYDTDREGPVTPVPDSGKMVAANEQLHG